MMARFRNFYNVKKSQDLVKKRRNAFPRGAKIYLSKKIFWVYGHFNHNLGHWRTFHISFLWKEHVWKQISFEFLQNFRNPVKTNLEELKGLRNRPQNARIPTSKLRHADTTWKIRLYILPDAVKRCDADELWSFLLPILFGETDPVSISFSSVSVRFFLWNDLFATKGWFSLATES